MLCLITYRWSAESEQLDTMLSNVSELEMQVVAAVGKSTELFNGLVLKSYLSFKKVTSMLSQVS